MIRLVADPSTNDSRGRALASYSAIMKKTDLGFWQLPLREENWQLSAKTTDELKKKFKRLVVLGMGGSALGGRALVETLSSEPEKVRFIYNSDPHSFWQFLEKDWDPNNDGWLIISKSGSTIEVLSMANALIEDMARREISISENIYVITETTDNPLHSWAKEQKINVIPHPTDVGGRFSALSPVGLIPAGFAGVSISSIREGAVWVLEKQALVAEFSGLVMDRFAKGESITVFWSYVDRLNSFLPWLEQLWAESLGKREDVLVSSPMLSYGTAYQHSVLQQYIQGQKDKFFVFFRSEDLESYGPPIQKNHFAGFDWIQGKTLGQIFHAEALATEKALQEGGRGTCVLSARTVDARVVGAWIMFFELVVATVGMASGINPFDQPGVERGKKIARDILNG